MSHRLRGRRPWKKLPLSGCDIAKQVFHAHGAAASGAAVFSRRITRQKLIQFFASQPRCTVAMEACAGAHHWGRELQRLGHQERLIPPAYVKPFVKRQKNDAADAEAICEAAQRPTMRFVPVKSEEQQASAAVFRARDLLGANAPSFSMHFAACSPSMAGLHPRGCSTRAR